MKKQLSDKLQISIAVAALTISAINFPVRANAEPPIMPVSHTIEYFDQANQDLMEELINQQFEAEQKQIQEIKIQNVKAEKLRVQEEIKQQHVSFVKLTKKKDIKYINLTTPSGLTAEEVDLALSDTELSGLGKAFVNAEKKYSINAYYLIAHAIWESGWGESKLAKTKNNLFGFSAYDSDVYNSARKFSSKAECISVVAKYISEHYLSEDGDHYNGANLSGMNKKYASDKNWAQGIANTMAGLVERTTTL